MTQRRREPGRPSAAAQRGGNSGRRTCGGRERLRLTQFVVCALIFVSVVAVKLLLPGKLSAIRSSVGNAMDKNMDVTEVFSAVGRAFSGKENFKKGARDVYQAVFHPEDGAVETAAAVPEGLEKTAAAAKPAEAGKALPAKQTQAGSAKTTPQKQETAKTSRLACVLYSAANCPKNVKMEQEVLGFRYCTPVQAALSSPFGYREHPVEGEERFHYGVDLAADEGTPIRCFADGTVTVSGESTSYGKYLIVAHRGGYATLYAHCSKLLIGEGKKVREGEKIAEVGQTGMATGPHLHFEIHHGNTYLNPVYYVSAERT